MCNEEKLFLLFWKVILDKALKLVKTTAKPLKHNKILKDKELENVEIFFLNFNYFFRFWNFFDISLLQKNNASM